MEEETKGSILQLGQGEGEEEQKRTGGHLSEAGAPSYCGRAFSMAFTSSATAVNANSN